MDSRINLRLLEPTDSLEELTRLINRAYAVPAALGVELEGATQGVDRTRQRIARGLCWVAHADDGKLVGTATVSAGWSDPACAYLSRPGLVCRYQLAVEPELHGAGVGHALRQETERWAKALDFTEMVGFTDESHSKQIRAALRDGATIVDRVTWPGDKHAHVVYAKPL